MEQLGSGTMEPGETLPALLPFIKSIFNDSTQMDRGRLIRLENDRGREKPSPAADAFGRVIRNDTNAA
jgi:hypothetical protein